MKRFGYQYLAGLFCLLVSMGATSASAAIISILPVAPNVTVGSTFDVTIEISGVTDLYAWQVDFGYDPLIVSVASVANGSFLGTGGAESFFAGNIDNLSGSVTAISSTLTSAFSGVSGSGILATITLNALAAGQSSLASFNIILLDSTFADIPATTESALVTVSADAGSSVPEPGTAALLLTAGTLFACWRGARR